MLSLLESWRKMKLRCTDWGVYVIVVSTWNKKIGNNPDRRKTDGKRNVPGFCDNYLLFSPRFLRRYLDMGEQMKGAVQQYITDVKASDFPNEDEQY